MINFTCAACRKEYSVAAEFGGRLTKCRNCGQSLQVPGVSAAKPTSPRPSPDTSTPSDRPPADCQPSAEYRYDPWETKTARTRWRDKENVQPNSLIAAVASLCLMSSLALVFPLDSLLDLAIVTQSMVAGALIVVWCVVTWLAMRPTVRNAPNPVMFLPFYPFFGTMIWSDNLPSGSHFLSVRQKLEEFAERRPRLLAMVFTASLIQASAVFALGVLLLIPIPWAIYLPALLTSGALAVVSGYLAPGILPWAKARAAAHHQAGQAISTTHAWFGSTGGQAGAATLADVHRHLTGGAWGIDAAELARTVRILFFVALLIGSVASIFAFVSLADLSSLTVSQYVRLGIATGATGLVVWNTVERMREGDYAYYLTEGPRRVTDLETEYEEALRRRCENASRDYQNLTEEDRANGRIGDRIAQFRKLVIEDPENGRGHFLLGMWLAENGNYLDAVKSFERALVICPDSPAFHLSSRSYQLLGECLIKLKQRDRAVEVLTKGWSTADKCGDQLFRDTMAKLLASVNAPFPQSKNKSNKWFFRF